MLSLKCVGLVPVLLMVSLCCVCHAQTRYRPPAGSTLPRQLDYFRADVGVLDPYNTFVAPRRQLDRTLQQMQTQERTDVQRAQQAMSQIRQSTAAPTGTGATFMNYSHYYGSTNTPVRASGSRSTSVRASPSYAGSSLSSSAAASAFGAGNYGADSYGASSFGTTSSGTRSYATPSYRANSSGAGGARGGSYVP